MLTTGMPFRLATQAWASSWNRIEAKKRRAVSSAVNQRPMVLNSGYASGSRPSGRASVQVTRARIRNVLGLIWIGMPQTCPIVILPSPLPIMEGGLPCEPVPSPARMAAGTSKPETVVPGHRSAGTRPAHEGSRCGLRGGRHDLRPEVFHNGDARQEVSAAVAGNHPKDPAVPLEP